MKMKKISQLGLVLAMLIGMVGFALPASASTPQSFSVLVGSENTSMGVSIMQYFPQVVKVHVGDTVTWNANSHEIHTVTFLANQALQPLIIPAPGGLASPLQVNPAAAFPHVPANNLYDGSTYVNSGIISTDSGFVQSFSLTFTHLGSFDYVCYVHGQMMMGTIQVVPANITIPSPAQVSAQGQAELAAAWLTVPPILAAARSQIVPPVKNPDGSFTHTITMGYMSGSVMVMGFFPKRDTVQPGDTVVWKLSSMEDAPHTVTFFNGAPDVPFVIIAFTQNGPVALVNPLLLFPSLAVQQGKPLNTTDYFNSGLMIPGVNTTFSLKIGKFSGTINYVCLLHDSSGMVGSLFIAPGQGK